MSDERPIDAAIVIAAGDGTRWGNHTGVPKHLAPFHGEPLITRTVKQALAIADTVFPVVPEDDDRYYDAISLVDAAERRRVRPVNPLHDDRWGGVAKFMSSRDLWADPGWTAVLYGDVYFTPDAVMRVAEVAIDGSPGDWRLVSRLGPSRLTGTRWGECFAQVFHHGAIDRHLAALRACMAMEASGQLKRTGGWEHYRVVAGGDPRAHRDYGMRVEVDDWTEDFDFPDDYDQWRANRRAAGLAV